MCYSDQCKNSSKPTYQVVFLDTNGIESYLVLDLLRKLPLLADLYRYLRINSLKLKRAQVSSSGFRIVGSESQVAETYEYQIAEFLLRNHQRFSHFINVGANTGYWAVYLRHHGFERKITLVEPDPLNVAVLKRNIRINRLQEIDVRKFAVGNSSGEIKLHGFGTGVSAIEGWAGGTSKRQIRVLVKTLDELFNFRINGGLILIDVEGFELEVLQGATSTLKLDHEFLIEITTFEHQPNAMKINPNFHATFSILQSHGYSIFGWLPNYQEIDGRKLQLIADQLLKPQIQMYHFKKVHN